MTRLLCVGFVVLAFLAGCATPGEVVDRCADHYGVAALERGSDGEVATCADGTVFVFDGPAGDVEEIPAETGYGR